MCSDEDINKLIDIFESYHEGIRTGTKNDAVKLRKIIRGFQSDLLKMQSEYDSDLMVPVFFE